MRKHIIHFIGLLAFAIVLWWSIGLRQDAKILNEMCNEKAVENFIPGLGLTTANILLITTDDGIYITEMGREWGLK